VLDPIGKPFDMNSDCEQAADLEDFIAFIPIPMERVWGGRDLAEVLGRTLPDGPPIGESWEIVDRAEAQSVVAGGVWKGRTLADIRREHTAALFGPQVSPEQPFPILVKWLDCQERLSLQVHPPAAVASELGGEPKTENWYVASAKEEASLIVGLKRGVNADDFAKALDEERLEDCVHRFPVAAGDSILVESGRLHAIDGGNLILEIQQNSDTTYRVYDWGRVGLDGKPRTLHVEPSMRSINFDDFEPEPLRQPMGDCTLAECREFRIRQFSNTTDVERVLELPDGMAQLVHAIKGGIHVGDYSLSRGENGLVPYVKKVQLRLAPSAVALVTDHFFA
jgi:mannose-6-phosphate isomerase